jgi:hypothetical protein
MEEASPGTKRNLIKRNKLMSVKVVLWYTKLALERGRAVFGAAFIRWCQQDHARNEHEFSWNDSITEVLEWVPGVGDLS